MGNVMGDCFAQAGIDRPDLRGNFIHIEVEVIWMDEVQLCCLFGFPQV